MKNKTGIYDLNNLTFLENDIENIFSKIYSLYSINFLKNEFIPLTRLKKEHYWASDEANVIFNALVPTVKSLTKDMYALVEIIYKDKLGKFKDNEKETLKNKYLFFNEFRELNNNFKHSVGKVEITLTKIVIEEKGEKSIDIFINFKYPEYFIGVLFSDLIKLFIKILEDNNVISIKRTK